MKKILLYPFMLIYDWYLGKLIEAAERQIEIYQSMLQESNKDE